MRARPQRGFSLIELIFAISLLLLFTVAGATAYRLVTARGEATGQLLALSSVDVEARQLAAANTAGRFTLDDSVTPALSSWASARNLSVVDALTASRDRNTLSVKVVAPDHIIVAVRSTVAERDVATSCPAAGTAVEGELRLCDGDGNGYSDGTGTVEGDLLTCVAVVDDLSVPGRDDYVARGPVFLADNSLPAASAGLCSADKVWSAFVSSGAPVGEGTPARPRQLILHT